MSKDNRRLTVFNALQLQENRDTALTLMRYTFLMFVAPIVTFYALVPLTVGVHCMYMHELWVQI